MDLTNMKKGVCTLKLEGLKKVYNEEGKVDPTLLKATFSILDFNASGNKQVVTKEECLKSAFSLKNKPLLCEYKETTDYENPNDDFGTHGEYQAKLRNGQDYIFTKTHAIGVSDDKGYLGVIKDENGNDLDVLMCDFLLWAYRYPNEVMLINEFYEKGETLYSSCEYYYSSSDMVDGIEYVKDLYFDGHTVLGRNVAPAYNSSRLISFNEKWNKALNELNKSKNKKEDKGMSENVMFKSLCELSLGDIRTKIMTELSKTMTAEEFNYVYVSNYTIYDNYFVYENYEDNKWVYYKVPYTKNEKEVTIDLGAKVVVERDSIWVEVGQMEAVQNSLNDANAKIEELIQSLNEREQSMKSKEEMIASLNSKIETLENEKVEITNKFNEQADMVVSLNAKIKEFEPIVEEYNKEQYEKALNTAIDFYKEKFENVGAISEFEKEETMGLIKKSISSDESEAIKAKFSLNEMIVERIKTTNSKKEENSGTINVSLNSTIKAKDNKDLLEHEDEFEKFYGFKRD